MRCLHLPLLVMMQSELTLTSLLLAAPSLQTRNYYVRLRALAYCWLCSYQPHPVRLFSDESMSMPPIFLAFEIGNMELVQMLIAKGADLNTPMK